ncbi:MAG TPA: TetR/AcrR family transcriptional regulator [Gemmatirosa sp.]
MLTVYSYNMTTNVHTVKIQRAPDRYHHGALRQALLAAAEAIIAERGVDGFSLREAARRAGVSPAAPQHHFGDARGLLTAVATTGFEQLADTLAAATAHAGPHRDARIRAQGLAYVAFALAQPARFDVMWRGARVDCDDPAYAAASRRAFAVLAAVVAGGSPEDAPETAPMTAPNDADPRVLACWAVVHGFARLALDGVFGAGAAAADAAADALLPAVLDCVRV